MARYDSRFTRYEVRKSSYEKIHLFLQNEPNFRKSQVNVSHLLTREYEQMDTWSIRKNEPKTNPNEPKTNPILANKTPIRTQTNPKQTQFILSLHLAKQEQAQFQSISKDGYVMRMTNQSSIEPFAYSSLPRLLIDPICPWRRSDCIRQLPALKQGSGNKEHFIACWKC
jgi:hypothetical protein